MGISKYTGDQAMDMGITEAAIRQAESHAETSMFMGGLLMTPAPAEMLELYPAGMHTTAAVPCNCEAAGHFNNTGHAYLGATAGTRWAQFVGRVCDECAKTCMANYLI